jgi:hypothetical protein
VTGLAAVTAASVALLPRVAWLLAAGLVVGWAALGPQPQTGIALVLAAGLVACPLLAPRAGRLWSLPAAAPLLGIPGLAAAYPALAGQAARLPRRAAMGALGAWWLALAAPLLGRPLHGGLAAGAWPAARWSDSLAAAATHAVWPAARGGVLLLAAVWAAAAVVLPWLVRGRSLAADLVGTGLWAVALAGATAAVFGGARGALPGALAGGVAALALRWARVAPPPPPPAHGGDRVSGGGH